MNPKPASLARLTIWQKQPQYTAIDIKEIRYGFAKWVTEYKE